MDLGKNEGAALINDLVTSKSTCEFSEGLLFKPPMAPKRSTSSPIFQRLEIRQIRAGREPGLTTLPRGF